MTQINTNAAINAYNRALKSGSNSRAEFETKWENLNVLRVGDQIDVVAKSEATPSFQNVMIAAMEPEVQKVRKAEHIAKNVFTGPSAGLIQGPDLVNLIESVNAADSAIQTVVTARDKMVEAWRRIYEMPI